MKALQTLESYGCLICPKDAEGFVTFECDTLRKLFTHLKKAHSYPPDIADAKIRRVMTLHLNKGAGQYSHYHNYVQDEKVIAVSEWHQYRPKRGKKK